MIEVTRRGIFGIIAAAVAPFIVRASSLMPVKPMFEGASFVLPPDVLHMAFDNATGREMRIDEIRVGGRNMLDSPLWIPDGERGFIKPDGAGAPWQKVEARQNFPLLVQSTSSSIDAWKSGDFNRVRTVTYEPHMFTGDELARLSKEVFVFSKDDDE